MNNMYKDIIDKIISFSNESNKENSIIYRISLKEKNILCNISLVDINGNKKQLMNQNIKLENKFYNFINPMLKSFIDNNEIILNDFVDMNGDNIVTYRLITSNNDQLTIDGLTFEDSSYIKDIINNYSSNSVSLDNSGKVDALFVITIAILFIFIIGCLIYFL